MGILKKWVEKNCRQMAAIFNRGKAQNLIRSSPYSWVTSREKIERYKNYFSSYRVNKKVFESLTLTFDLYPIALTLGKQNCQDVCMNHELNPCWFCSQKAACGAETAAETIFFIMIFRVFLKLLSNESYLSKMCVNIALRNCLPRKYIAIIDSS